MKKSIVLPAFFPNVVTNLESLIDRLELVAFENFYDTIEFFYEGKEEDRIRIKKYFEHYNFENIFLAAYHLKKNNLNLGDVDRQKRENAINITKQLVDEAYFYNSKKMMVVSGIIPKSEDEESLAFDYLIDSLIQICDYARDKANGEVLTISLEYFNDVGEPYFLIGPTHKAKKLAELIKKRCDNFELTLDLSHLYQLNENPKESFSNVKEFVNHIHLANCVTKDKNNPLFGDKHPSFNIPEGDVDQESIVEFLKYINHSGVSENCVIGIEVIANDSSKEEEIYHLNTDIFKNSLKIKNFY